MTYLNDLIRSTQPNYAGGGYILYTTVNASTHLFRVGAGLVRLDTVSQGGGGSGLTHLLGGGGLVML